MSIKQKLSSLAIAAGVVLAGTSLANAVPAWATTNVNVRDGATTRAPVIDTLRRGERVDIDYCRGSWCFVNRRGPDGWVSANYLSRGGGGDYFDDDDYYDDGFYIERPRVRRVWPRYRRFDPGFSACVGGPNARFCISD